MPWYQRFTTSTGIGSGVTSTAVSHSLNGLSEATTYYFRIAVQNEYGTTRGGTLSFSTDQMAGNGTDGSGLATGNVNCQTDSLAGRPTADCAATGVNSTSNSGQKTVSVSSTTGFASGDEVMIIQILGTGAGNYEFNTVSSTGAGSLGCLNVAVAADGSAPIWLGRLGRIGS